MRLVQVTIPWATETIERLSQVPNFLPKANPFTVLLDQRNLFFQIDEVGLIAVLEMADHPKLLHVHVTFWDGRLRGREGLCRALATWVSRITDKFLFTQVPANRPAVLAFAGRVGFIPSNDIGDMRTLVFSNYTG